MYTITARNVNEAVSEAFWKLRISGTEEDSRNGKVIAFPKPVVTTYKKPNERVLFWRERDANPIFHLMESIWMLAGRNDVGFLEQFNSTIGQFSDNGYDFNAAYGYRWREHFGQDQLLEIIELLRRDPTTRQAVMQIWDHNDLTKKTKDKACNTQVFFEIRGGFTAGSGQLNMTVINRSNDMWWGCYGANVVHFSVLQEFVAAAVNVPLGEYRQFSHNLHLYTDLYDAKKYLDAPPVAEEYNLYETEKVKTYPIMTGTTYEKWLSDAEAFCHYPFACDPNWSPFFKEVAYPMAMVSHSRKTKLNKGYDYAVDIKAQDWKLATLQWMYNRDIK